MTAHSKSSKRTDRFAWNERTARWRQAVLLALAEGRTRMQDLLPLLREDSEVLRAASVGGLVSESMQEAIDESEADRLAFRYVGDFDEPVGIAWAQCEILTLPRTTKKSPQLHATDAAASSDLPLFTPSRWTGRTTTDRWARTVTTSSDWRGEDQGNSLEFRVLEKMPRRLRSDPDFIGPLLFCHGIVALAFAAPNVQCDPDILRAVFSPSVSDEGGSASEAVDALESALTKPSAKLYGPATAPAGKHFRFQNEGRMIHVFCLAQEEVAASSSSREIRSSFLLWAEENDRYIEPDIAAVQLRSRVTIRKGSEDYTILNYEIRSPYNNIVPEMTHLDFFSSEDDDGDDDFEFEDDEE